MPRSVVGLVAPCLMVISTACTGAVEVQVPGADSTGAPPGAGTPIAPAPPGATKPEEFFPGAVRVPTSARYWRLSFEQYDHAVSDLVGSEVHPSSELGFPREPEGFAGWLHQSRGLDAKEVLASSFEAAAVKYAPTIAARLPPCTASDAVCAGDLVKSFGKRAWRRPLAADEVTRYSALFTSSAAELDAQVAAQLVVEGMLRSPFFLFRSEVGDPDRRSGPDVRLTPHEIASALSFGLWNRPPDGELLRNADSGSLDDAKVRVAQGRRLMNDPRFLDVFYGFLSEWFGFYNIRNVQKDARAFPEFSGAIAAGMATETRAFLDDLLAAGRGSYQRLLTSGDPATPYRVGLLMQPSYLTAQAGPSGTSPTRRGVFVVRRISCFDLPPPDPNAVGTTPKPDPSLTTRESFERHKRDPACAACHTYFDPIGVTFENFDGTGRYRTTENGRPIDSSGMLAAGVLGPDAITFKDATDVARTLAGNPRAHQCAVRKAFQYFFGREDLTTDAPLLREAMRSFTGAELDLRELVLAFVGSPEFAMRRPAAGP